jgi:hypothetical protein
MAASIVAPVLIMSSTTNLGRPVTSPTSPPASTVSPLMRVLRTTGAEQPPRRDA